ncbi:MAG: hypothetical protein JNM64_19835 [Chloroflexia bacterium]|nr:hypothetical protein [Chloroflexia bacterium]
MFLGTSRIWWIISGVLLVLGFALMALGQTVFGILTLFAAIGSFAAAPMRYGENAKLTRQERREKEAAARVAATAPASTADTPIAHLPPAPPLPPRERPTIAGRDASEV